MRIIVFIFILTLFGSCISQELKHEENVRLEYETGWQREHNTYYEVGSDKPFTGQFVCSTLNGNVTIDFKKGKMNGDFVRFNTEGDTTEYITYNDGLKTYQLDLQYKNGHVIHRGEHIVTKGSLEDKQIFDKASAFIVSSDYNGLDNYLNAIGSYRSELISLTKQFGNLNSIEITEIENQYHSYNERADIRAKMILKYQDIQLNVMFLIVKDDTGELRGQGIVYKPVQDELIPDNKIEEILDEMDNTSSKYKILNTTVWPGQNMIYIKNYLVEIDGKNQVLNVWYKSNSNHKLLYSIYHIKPLRKVFEGMHWN